MTNSTMSTFSRAGSTFAVALVATSQNMSAHVAEIFPLNRNLDSELQSSAKIGRLATIARAVANGVSAYLRHFIVGLHETRRQQAALVLVRYRHLICEDDTSSMSKTNPTNAFSRNLSTPHCAQRGQIAS